jgi:hypothetical protein
MSSSEERSERPDGVPNIIVQFCDKDEYFLAIYKHLDFPLEEIMDTYIGWCRRNPSGDFKKFLASVNIQENSVLH